MNFRHLIFLSAALVALLAAPSARAQTDAMLSNYFEVPSYYNPAAIGNTDFVRIRAAGRLQWMGIDNAPQTFLGTANTPVRVLGKRFGVGLVAQHDKEGLYSNFTADLQLGYKLRLFKGELTAAVQVGLLDQGFKGSKVVLPDNDDYHQSTDEAIPTSDIHGTGLDLGAGVFFNHPKFWAGVSCTHVNSPTIRLQGEGGNSQGTVTEGEGGEGTTVKNFEFTANRTLYFIAGGNIQIKNTLFEVMPSVMVMSDLKFYTGQATARVRYNGFLSVGVGYRYNDAVTALVGVEYKNFYIGYSFDYSTTAIAKASSGSHEVVAGYSLKLDFNDKNKHRHKNIRLM